jgi:hypothetical protein
MNFAEKIKRHYIKAATAAAPNYKFAVSGGTDMHMIVNKSSGMPLAVFTTEALATSYLTGMKRNEEWTVETIECDPTPSDD